MGKEDIQKLRAYRKNILLGGSRVEDPIAFAKSVGLSEDVLYAFEQACINERARAYVNKLISVYGTQFTSIFEKVVPYNARFEFLQEKLEGMVHPEDKATVILTYNEMSRENIAKKVLDKYLNRGQESMSEGDRARVRRAFINHQENAHAGIFQEMAGALGVEHEVASKVFNLYEDEMFKATYDARSAEVSQILDSDMPRREKMDRIHTLENQNISTRDSVKFVRFHEEQEVKRIIAACENEAEYI